MEIKIKSFFVLGVILLTLSGVGHYLGSLRKTVEIGAARSAQIKLTRAEQTELRVLRKMFSVSVRDEKIENLEEKLIRSQIEIEKLSR